MFRPLQALHCLFHPYKIDIAYVSDAATLLDLQRRLRTLMGERAPPARMLVLDGLPPEF